MLVNRYNLNTIPCRVHPNVFVSQYDEARRIYFDLYEGNETYTPSGEVFVLIGTEQLTGTIDGNSIYFDVGASLTQQAKKCLGEVIIKNNGELGTCNFNFIVDSTPVE